MADQTPLPQAMDPAWMQEYLTLNPHRSQGDGVWEWVMNLARSQGKPVDAIVGQYYPEAQGSTGANIRGAYSDVIGRPGTSAVSKIANQLTEPLVGLQRMINADEPLSQIIHSQAERAGNPALLNAGPPNPLSQLFPQTPAQLATVAAAGPVSGVGTGVMGAAGRTGAMALLSGAVNKLTGGTFGEGATGGALAQAGGEALRAGAGLLDIAGRQVTRGRQLAESNLDAENFARGGVQDVPWFAPGFKGRNFQQGLYWLSERAPGRRNETNGARLLRDGMEATDQQIYRGMGGQGTMIQVPAIDVYKGAPVAVGQPSGLVDQFGRPAPSTQGVGSPGHYTIKEALETLREAKQAAASLPSSADTQLVKQNVKDMQDQILNAIQLRGGNTDAVAFRYAMDQYQKGLGFLRTLSDSKAFESPLKSGTGPVLNGDVLRSWLSANRDEVGAGLLPNVHTMLWRGQTPGAQNVTTSYGGQRIHLRPLPVSVHGPRYDVTTEPLGGKVKLGTTIPSIGTMTGANLSTGYTVE